MGGNWISYLRVSTQRQGRSGLGLEAQRETIAQYVASVGGTIREEHIEVETGSMKDRPILAMALAACKRTKATLVVAKLDRLSRNVAHVAGLMDAGVDFRAVDAPFANRFVVHVLAAVSEYEREQISARTKAALAAAKARGVVLGSFGRTLADRNIADATAFAESLRAPIGALLKEGATRLQDIADGLNSVGFVTRQGAKWGPAAVQRTLLRLDLRTPAMVASGSTAPDRKAA